MIRTVIFDLGGVYFTDGSAIAIEQISTTYRLAEAKVRDIVMGDLGSRYRHGAVTSSQFWEGAVEAWNLQVPIEQLATTWLQAYEPIPGTVSLIDRLGVAGYELLYLSDNVEDRIEYLEETYGFLHRFKDGVFSHRVGIRKPNPRIYELVLEKAAHPPAQCLFVDDKPPMLEPAERMGMAVVAFESPSQVETVLVGHGLQF
jgi:putative hydrolase of the HAD superfamily